MLNKHNTLKFNMINIHNPFSNIFFLVYVRNNWKILHRLLTAINYDVILKTWTFFYLVTGIDFVDATRLGKEPGDVQLQIASNIRTITLWARVTTRLLFNPLINDRAARKTKRKINIVLMMSAKVFVFMCRCKCVQMGILKNKLTAKQPNFI